MVNGIVEIVYYAVLGPGMDTSRPKPYIICFTYSVDKKKGQATSLRKKLPALFLLFTLLKLIKAHLRNRRYFRSAKKE